MLMDLIPFHADLLDNAAELLAARHRRNCQTFPALPTRFADAAEAHKAVVAAWRRPWARGVAAFEGEKMVGYLFADALFDQLLGRTSWVRLAGHAASADVDVDLYRDLYAAAAPAWLELGCFDHYVMVPAAERAALEAWFALGFGQQQAYGLRPITVADGETVDTPAGLTIRRAESADRTAFRGMALLTATHQAQAPVWAPTPPEVVATRPEAYAGVLDDDEATLWLAWRGDTLVGFQIYYPAEPADEDLFIPKQCAELPAAATRPEARGQGVGRLLTAHALKHLHDQGYVYCLADWRTTNLLAARFWPRRGFDPVAYRLHRRIDERVLWAKGQSP